MNKLITALKAGVLMVLLTLSACSSLGGEPKEPALGKQAPTSGVAATAVLLHAPVGSASLTWDAARQMLSVTMHVSGLAPNSTHPVHIHLGVCNTPGPLLYPLPDLRASASGQASMSATVAGVARLPGTGWLINIHNGPTMTDQNSQNLAIACATLTMKQAATTGALKELVNLGKTTAPNEAASGTANLSVVATKTLRVSVSAHGLVPGSRHAAHIHAGSCLDQGNTLYPLPDLVADANGDANSSMVFPGVAAIPASGWYVNIHFGVADAKGHMLPPVFNPIACGNVMLN